MSQSKSEKRRVLRQSTFHLAMRNVPLLEFAILVLVFGIKQPEMGEQSVERKVRV